MIRTQLYNAKNPGDLQGSINFFLEEKHITVSDLIDIKYSQCAIDRFNPAYTPGGGGLNSTVMFFSALIIYKTIRPQALKSNMNLTRPEEHREDELPDTSF